jgi:serine/threonine protein kinase
MAGLYNSPVLAEGTILDDKYEIRGRLGGGGMGDVYLARRRLLGDDVAVKLIRPSGPDPDEWRERFLREARACAQLRHPHIVSVLDFSVDDHDRPYLVMEYLNGPSLADELRSRGRFDLTSARQVVRAVGGALSLAHASGVAHRDLKPQNIVSHRYQSGEVVYKVIDFGLVTLRAGDDQTPLTSAHEFLGTVAYAAPEQFSGAPADARSDQYSLGVIAYELLAGARPFTGDGLMALVSSHLSGPPPSLAERRADLPPEIASAVMRALERDAGRRWPSVAAFVTELSEHDDTETTSVSPPVSGLSAIYELGPVIARGRFGSEIHAGTHRALGLPVAIRLLRTTGRDDREAVRDRFLKEARALQVPHPNLLQVRDFGEDGDLLYLVTELLEGVSLAERLEQAGPLPLATLDRFVRHVVEATGALHRRQSLISGLHPGIIRLVHDADGERLVISTAGVSQIQDVLATLDVKTLRHGGEVSELQYVAPEILTGQPATIPADIYTIGAIAHEMATGRRPYEATALPMLLGAILAGPPPDPQALRPTLGEGRATVILRTLSRDPAARFASTADLLRAWNASSLGPAAATH